MENFHTLYHIDVELIHVQKILIAPTTVHIHREILQMLEKYNSIKTTDNLLTHIAKYEKFKQRIFFFYSQYKLTDWPIQTAPDSSFYLHNLWFCPGFVERLLSTQGTHRDCIHTWTTNVGSLWNTHNSWCKPRGYLPSHRKLKPLTLSWPSKRQQLPQIIRPTMTCCVKRDTEPTSHPKDWHIQVHLGH